MCWWVGFGGLVCGKWCVVSGVVCAVSSASNSSSILVELFFILIELFLLEGLTLAKKKVDFSSVKCVCFVSRPTNIFTFLWKNGETPNGLFIFSRERDTFRKQIMEIVWDFVEKSFSKNGKTLEIVEDVVCEAQSFIFKS